MARAKTKPWHEDDRFWEIAAPVLFPLASQASVPAEVRAIAAIARLAPGNTVLDQGSGPGRYTLELARAGYVPTGIDRTAAYLARAAASARTEKLPARFEHGDVRRFVRPEAFDAVINMHDTVGLFEEPADDRRVLANAWASLKPGGVLVLALRPRHGVAVGVREEDYREVDGLDLLEERILPAGSDRQAIHWVFYQGDERHEFHLQIRLYEPAELEAALRAVGFRHVTFHADLALTPYDEGARRLVAVAYKAN